MFRPEFSGGFLLKREKMETEKILYNADMHLSMGKAKEAVALYDSVLTNDCNCYSAWLGKGTALKSLSRYKEALDCYERALTLNRSSIMAEFMAGFLRNELRK
jgi:tetratricopeptide (TPR) repeat protein